MQIFIFLHCNKLPFWSSTEVKIREINFWNVIWKVWNIYSFRKSIFFISAYKWLLVIVLFLDYDSNRLSRIYSQAQHVLQCIFFSFLKDQLGFVFGCEPELETESLTFLGLHCSSKNWKYITLLWHTNNGTFGNAALQKKATQTSLEYESQQMCFSKAYGNIHIIAAKASLLCSEILLFSPRSQHVTEISCLPGMQFFVRTGQKPANGSYSVICSRVLFPSKRSLVRGILAMQESD